MLHTAFKVAERLAQRGIEVGVVDIFNIDAFNAGRFRAMLASYSGIVTMEEGFRGRGGLDAMVFDFVNRNAIPARILNLGVEPGYRFELGTRAELHELVGIGIEAVDKGISAFARNLSSTLVKEQ
jgi:transketolase